MIYLPEILTRYVGGIAATLIISVILVKTIIRAARKIYS